MMLDRRGFLRLGLGSAAALAGCCPCNIQTRYGWNNAINTAGVDPKRIAHPASLQELVSLIRDAEEDGQGVRMAGSGHSFSDVAFSDGYLFLPDKLRATLTLDRAQLRAAWQADPHLVRVESGLQLRDLNPWLYERGLALSNMGGYDIQTIVGAASTGTHGSGLKHGPIASQIVSVQLVTKGGLVLQVEPANGITDPTKFPGAIATPAGAVPARLEQNDDVFNAVTVSMGCMGVVYAVVLRTVPRYWLLEIRELTTWAALRAPGGFLDRVLKGQMPLVPAPEAERQRIMPGSTEDPEYYEIYVNPYPPQRCVLTKRYKLATLPPKLKRKDTVRGLYGTDALQAAAIWTGKGAALVDTLNNFPGAAPGIIDGSLNALADHSFVDVSYNVFNLGPPNLVRVYGIEMAFGLEQSVQAGEHLFRMAAEFREDGVVHASPPSLRFVKPATALLAPQYGRPTMMLEMGMLVCQKGAEELLTRYEEYFIERLGARPHWGLDLGVLRGFDEVRKLYGPAADRWYAVYRNLNEKGTFNGRFTDRLRISVDS